MKYNLVALFDEESNRLIEETQRNLCKKYKLYKTQQRFCIHIQTVVDPDVEKLDKIIKDILAPYKKFKVQLDHRFYFDKSFKTVSLKIEQGGYINTIIRTVTDILALSGFNIQDEANRDLCLPLANLNYYIRKSIEEDASDILNTSAEDICYNFAKVNSFELCRPINNKKEAFIKDYPLREY